MPYKFKLPDLGEGVVEGEIVQWLIQSGQTIKEDQAMVEIMTDKATVEIPSPVAGTVVRTIGAEGEIVAVGTTLVVIEGADEQPLPPPVRQAATPTNNPEAKPPTPPTGARFMATPAVRRLARESGVDLTTVQGSGAGGRIIRQDVEEAAQSGGAASQPPVVQESSPQWIPYRGLRKKIGDHMVAAKRFAPHYTYVDEVDVTRLAALRERLNSASPEHRLSFLPFLVKACVTGLKKYPLLNAVLDEENQRIHLSHHYNIGIATAMEEGLIVPVVKAADQQTLAQLAGSITALTERARNGKARLEDLRDGTFTITSLGQLGGLVATPIINYPEVAILGVHKIVSRAVVRSGKIVIREMMNLSLSLDHRVVDGVVGAQFLTGMIGLLEDPESLSD